MTYYRGNVYTDPSTAGFAHDECLPDDEFDPIIINGQTTDEYGEPHGRQQKSPWNWSPVYGAPEPCDYCGKPVR